MFNEPVSPTAAAQSAFADSCRLSDIRAFCINLDARTDRWEQAQQRFKQLDWPVTRWPGVKLTQSHYAGLSTAHAGCLDSHKQIWQHCVDNKLGVIAVFEDDVLFSTDFIEVFCAAAKELPSDWHLWHLHSANAYNTKVVGRYLVEYSSGGWGTQGYLVTENCCSRLLAMDDGYNRPVDCRTTGCLTDAGVPPHGMIPEYTLCFQDGGASDIPDTADINFWLWHRGRYYR
jgi:hypothetical protein